jgi:hypothetical protein
LAEQGNCALMAPCKGVYGYSEDIAAEDHLLHQISIPCPPYAVRSRCQLPADTDIIPLSDTNMAVVISHWLQVTVFHVSRSL